MKHTEDEARQKWCPWARVVEYDDRDGSDALEGFPVGNRSVPYAGRTGPHPHARCIASQCMGWVWTDKEGHPKRKGMCGYLTNINVNAHFAVPQQQRPPLIGRG